MTSRELPEWVATSLAAIVCVIALTWLQYSFPALLDGDSYFHSRASQQLWEHGIQREFQQAVFSTWKSNYSDKDFLFHLVIMPFMLDPDSLLSSGKLAVIVLTTFFFSGLVLTMRGLNIRFGWLWIFFFFSASPWLVSHLLLLRPHLLALLLVELEILALLRGRFAILAVLTALHVLTHSSHLLVLGLPLALSTANFLRQEAISKRAWWSVVVGLAAATMLHPYFPNNVSVTYDQVFALARNVWGGEGAAIPPDLFGSELFGIPPADFLLLAAGWLPGLIGATFAFLQRPLREASRNLVTLSLITLGLVVLTLLSTRFFAFFALSAALLAGVAWSELAGNTRLRELFRSGPNAAWAATLFLAVALAFAQINSNVLRVRDGLEGVRSPVVYRDAIEFLDGVARPDDGVFHAFWKPFSWLYHFRPEGRYVEGLDPIFFYQFDPELFARALSIYRGDSTDTHRILIDDFDARWVFVAKLRQTRYMRAQLAREPGLWRAYSDRYAEVWRVRRPDTRD